MRVCDDKLREWSEVLRETLPSLPDDYVLDEDTYYAVRAIYEKHFRELMSATKNESGALL